MLPSKKYKKQNRTAMVLMGFILVLLVVVISVKSIELRQIRAEYASREAKLAEEILYEENRAEEIAEYEKYTQTKAYVEDVARNMLGLVYEGEILFKDEN